MMIYVNKRIYSNWFTLQCVHECVCLCSFWGGGGAELAVFCSGSNREYPNI
jgi:hypothetical protein